MTPALLMQDGVAQKWLVDPPRDGAFALVKALADLHLQKIGAPPREPQADGAESPSEPVDAAALAGWRPPQRIVYVSCNPSTLARDAGLLVHHAGYRCSQAGAVNMFPHTAHVESIAVFDYKGG